MPLEIACFSAPSVVSAARAGADRIELCADYAAGGVTPSLSTLYSIEKELDASSHNTTATGSARNSYERVPINVMIRPRAGSFAYSAAEFSEMKSNIEMFKASRNVDGFVFGILTEKGEVDEARNRELVEAAQPLSCTFHRAIDEVEDQDSAFERIIECGFKRILTSGGARSASEGRARVAELQKKFSKRLSIILGGGIRSSTVLELRAETEVEWLHSAAITGPEEEVDSEEVRKMVKLLQNA